MDAITLSGPVSAGNLVPATNARGAAEPADPNRFEAALDEARSPRSAARHGSASNGHDRRAGGRGSAPSPARATDPAGAASTAGSQPAKPEGQPAKPEGQPATAGIPDGRTVGGGAADSEAAPGKDCEQHDEGGALTAETAAVEPVPVVPPAGRVESSPPAGADESKDATVDDGRATGRLRTDQPHGTMAARTMPRGIVAQDAGREPSPPAGGLRARVSAPGVATVRAGAQGAAFEPALAPAPVAAEDLEVADVGDRPATVQAAEEAPARAGAGLPGGRAYLRAVRALENSPWTDALAAGTAVATDRPSRVADGSPVPVPVSAITEVRPQPAPASLSANATAFLRSLGMASAPTAPQVSEDRASAGADLRPSPADVMAAVAIEFAAASAGDHHPGGSSPETGSDRRDVDRGADTPNRLSHSTESFTVVTPPIPAVRADSAPASPATPPGSPAVEPPVTGQVVKAVALAWRDGIGEARIRLTPEHLGEVTVSMRVERGQVTAQVVAETATARAWIEAHQQDLRDGLSQQGLHLDRLVVTADGRRQQQQPGDGADRQRRQPPRARSGQEPPRFELTV